MYRSVHQAQFSFSFMVQHIYDLFKHIKKSGRYSDWLGTMERVKNQVVLRIVTCCQIASKLTSHYKVSG